MFSKTLFSLALLASSAMAAITFTSAPSTVEAGQTYTLKYTTEDTVTPISIILRKGDPLNLGTIGPLTTSATGGSFTWTAPTTLASGTDYAFEIEQGTDINYYGPFSLTGGTAPVSSSAALVSASATASSSGSIASVVLSSAHSSVSAKPSNYANSTTTKTTLSTSLSTARLSTSSGASATATKAPSNGASSISSPIALIIGAVAAMFYLH